MASIQERLQIKREPLDKWSVREQLCLAVARSGDQNWGSVSRALKPFGEPNRPADWFHQKNCAAQYGALLANVETPKRKKRTSGTEVVNETPAESIVKKLLLERQAELRKLLAEEKSEYQKLQAEMALLQSGKVSEEQLDKWCKEIDEEEHRKEQEVIAYNQWLSDREIKKQEIDMAFRPTKPTQIVGGQKRKISESGSLPDNVVEQHIQTTAPEPPKSAPSPLLTSLLKSPSQVQNVATSSILHTAITHQRSTNVNNTNTNTTNPTIASLLNSSSGISGITVSPGLQQLVSSAIGQEPVLVVNSENTDVANIPVENVPDTQDIITANDILDDPNLPNIKIEDIESSIIVPDGPLPEIKHEVDDIISDLIENADDLVNDPEQHLDVDVNGELNVNIELDELEQNELEEEEREKEEVQKSQSTEPEKVSLAILPTVDPFEFQEDPEVFEPTKSVKTHEAVKTISNQSTQEESKNEEKLEEIEEMQDNSNKGLETEKEDDEEEEDKTNEIKSNKTLQSTSSIETDEVVETEDDDTTKDSNKTVLVEDDANSIKLEPTSNEESIENSENKSDSDNNMFEELSKTSLEDPNKMNTELIKKEAEINLDVQNSTESNTLSIDFAEELYDDINMEVKIDKSGKAKRDYSRTKKKDEKEFDVLLTIEKVQKDDIELGEESYSDKDYSEIERKDNKLNKLKVENERSNSPWTEEEELVNLRSKRRYSSATPNDSVPNSPASIGIGIDDDRDYRNWKKAVMLVYNRLATNKYASLFSKPITDEQAPGYHSIVYRPMDLLTIRKNIENGVIRTTQEFQRDVLLMLNNAIMYNKTNDIVYTMARHMQQESMQQIQIFLQAQSEADAPIRRETRTSEPGSKRKRPLDDGRGKKRKED